MYDVMLDLETLSTRPTAAIIQIGAVLFEPKSGGKILNGTDKVFNAHVFIQDEGGTIDHSTVMFWFRQPYAKHMADQSERYGVPLIDALRAFSAWPNTVLPGTAWSDINRVWSNGAAFDQPILQAAYNRIGLDQPWNFWASRCCRTLFDLVGGKPEIDKTGFTDHDAADDAIMQAMQVQKAMGMLTPLGRL